MWISVCKRRGKSLMPVIVAAGALILAGCSGGGGSSKPVTTPRPRPTTTVASSTPAVLSTTTTTAASAPAGGPVPAGFRAQSATFVSADQGWVLGTAPCATAPCTSIVRTSDDGGTWAGIPAPTDGLENPQSGSTIPSGVSEIRFADNLNGWVFGPDLWSTHDGGAMWSHITSGPGASRVVDLESSGGFVYVVTEQCSDQASTCPGQLWRSGNTTDAFQTLATFAVAPEDAYAGPILAVHDATGYVVTAATTGAIGTPALLVTANGTSWSTEPNPCPAQLDEISVGPGRHGPGGHALFRTGRGWIYHKGGSGHQRWGSYLGSCGIGASLWRGWRDIERGHCQHPSHRNQLGRHRDLPLREWRSHLDDSAFAG